jgi:hypothetical protein
MRRFNIMSELKSIDEIAKECIEGLHGTGNVRKRKLEKEGYDYEAVKERVKELRAEAKEEAKKAKSNESASESEPVETTETSEDSSTEETTNMTSATTTIKVSPGRIGSWEAETTSKHFKDDKEKVEEAKKVEPLTPAEYFETVKGKITEETTENCKKLYDTTMKTLKKFMVTGQKSAAKDLYARCIYLEKELKLLELGVTKYVLRTDIDNFIDNVADDCVCVIEMRNFDRPIPDAIIDKVAEVQDCFDEFYIIFTDYTGEKRSKVKEEKREKDPILFGNIFIDGKVSPKMYFIGDWVDEFCDLTLDKMISKLAENEKDEDKAFLYDITDETTLDNIEKELFGTSKRAEARAVSVAGKA